MDWNRGGIQIGERRCMDLFIGKGGTGRPIGVCLDGWIAGVMLDRNETTRFLFVSLSGPR